MLACTAPQQHPTRSSVGSRDCQLWNWRHSIWLLPATLVALTREASEASAINHELGSKNTRCHCCTTTTFVEGTGEQATRRASACDAHTPHDCNHQQQTSSTFPLFFFAALEAFSSCFFFLTSLASCFADPFPAFFFAMLCVGVRCARRVSGCGGTHSEEW